MVAKVITGKNIQGALSYNEHKVSTGQAACILAQGFMKAVDDLSFYEKLERFTNLTEHNRRAKTNTVHISLNFDPSEKFDKDTLNAIASAYMEKIGFGDQPYLVYRHDDAAHPHIHIVTTNIRRDGRRISLHNIGRNQSEKARREVETGFGLVRAEGKKRQEEKFIHPVDVKKVMYGKSETKRSLSNVVRMITQNYKYTSLPELNAALQGYHVTAYRGKEGSKMHTNKGLLYSLINEKGERVGIPIKASAIPGKPTLEFLEKQFVLHKALRQSLKEPLKKTLYRSLQSPHINTLSQLEKSLEKQGVSVTWRTNTDGYTYGVTYVDHRNRTVFNGSSLGKRYSAKAILDRLETKPVRSSPHVNPRSKETSRPESKQEPIQWIRANQDQDILKEWISPTKEQELSPEVAMRMRKKRKKK